MCSCRRLVNWRPWFLGQTRNVKKNRRASKLLECRFLEWEKWEHIYIWVSDLRYSTLAKSQKLWEASIIIWTYYWKETRKRTPIRQAYTHLGMQKQNPTYWKKAQKRSCEIMFGVSFQSSWLQTIHIKTSLSKGRTMLLQDPCLAFVGWTNQNCYPVLRTDLSDEPHRQQYQPQSQISYRIWVKRVNGTNCRKKVACYINHEVNGDQEE
jgi:hypothetical protein